MKLVVDLHPNGDPNLTCIVCGGTDCGCYFTLKDHRNGRHSALGIHRDCADHQNDVMHPYGHCSCGGENACEWCKRYEPLPNQYLSGLADAACTILRDIRAQVAESPAKADATAACDAANKLLRTVSFID